MDNFPTFKINGILLKESHFLRIPEIHFNDGEITDSNINIQSQSRDEKIVIVELSIDIKSKYKNTIQFEIKASMVGIFETEKAAPEHLESFSNINAPAIIFPFLREHICSLSIKAGIQPMILPPINFVEYAKSKGNTIKSV
jgi:preprotein translocase subunit SecB